MRARIFVNGNFWAPGRSGLRNNSLSTLGGKILCIGDNQACMDAFPARIKPEVTDLEGKTVLPGFIDSHLHLLSFGLTLRDLSLSEVTSIDELKATIATKAAETPKDGWILGRGWDQEAFAEKRYPTRKDLDEVSGGRPVYLTRSCGHVSVASSKALHIAQVTRDSQDPPGGAIDKDPYGDPTGVLRENAQGLVRAHIPDVDDNIMEDALKQGMEHILSRGITSVHTNDGQAGFPGTMDLYKRVHSQGFLLRTYWDVPSTLMPDLFDTPLRTGDGDDYFKIGAIKLFADGSLGGRTAALEEAYSDDPANWGILVIPPKELQEQVYFAHAHGMQVAVHAIGDRAAKVSLHAISSAQSRIPGTSARHRLVHVQILSPHLITEMRRIKAVADVQPKFISTDMRWALDRVGIDRMRSSYSWRTMLRAGIPLAGGSDCPVEPPDPLFGIYCAVTRKDMDGNPPSGFFPNERLTLDQAIGLFTMGGAFAAHEENKKGSLTPGKFCDFLVLSDDITSVDPEMIKDLKVVQTVVGGKTVYLRS